MWKLVTTITGMLGAMAVKELLRAGYRATHRDTSAGMPAGSTSARFSWPNALVWGAAAGIGLVIARIASARVAALGWAVATGKRPPGFVEDTPIV
jgi:hypothetical protein